MIGWCAIPLAYGSFPKLHSLSSPSLSFPSHFPPQTVRHSTLSPLSHLSTKLHHLTQTLSCSNNNTCTPTSLSPTSPGYECHEIIVVNFYKFVPILDPQLEITRHLSFLEGLGIHGRIYINEQGINAQFSGPSDNALQYVKWLKEDHRFSDILVQISPSPGGHAFPRLKLRYKRALVQVDEEVQDLPVLDPSMRATPLSPAEWRKRLDSLNSNKDASSGGDTKGCVLLDVRNGYEWDIGHFDGAQRPEVDSFRNTSFGLSDAEVTDSDPLVNVDKEKTEILMYCTGGIRCDVYSTILREKGFKNLYTLEGGIAHYLQTEGTEKWKGNLFVFDSRRALPPSTLKPGSESSSTSQGASADSKFAKCYICGSEVQVLRHRNCANLDCNLLYLCCRDCVDEMRGCCCRDCTSAPRLRPVASGNSLIPAYQKWHIYRDNKLEQETISL